MSGACERCPCPETCLRWPVFCAWAAEDPLDEVRIRHIRARSAPSAIGGEEPGAATPAKPSGPPHPESGRWAPANPGVAEAIALVRAMRDCRFRSTDPGCGCAGGRCALRRGSMVSHIDCMECLRRFPDS